MNLCVFFYCRFSEDLAGNINEEEEVNWYVEEALPLGRCLGFKEHEDECLKALLCDLNLNFGKSGKPAKKLKTVVAAGTVERDILSDGS